MSNPEVETFRRWCGVGIKEIRSRNIGWLSLMIPIGKALGLYTYYIIFCAGECGGSGYEVAIVKRLNMHL